jgi:hypothetical protein
MGQLEEFIEYAKIHIISLEQDLESVTNKDYPIEYLQGALATSRHFLSVATDILNGGEDR